MVLKCFFALAGIFCVLAVAYYFNSGKGRGLVAGQVFDENRHPLGGASIVVEGMPYSILTNDSGYFSFDLDSAGAKGEFTLIYSKAGFSSSNETYFELPKTDIVKYLLKDTVQP